MSFRISFVRVPGARLGAPRRRDLSIPWSKSGRADDLCRCAACIAACPERAAYNTRTSRALRKRLDRLDLRELTP